MQLTPVDLVEHGVDGEPSAVEGLPHLFGRGQVSGHSGQGRPLGHVGHVGGLVRLEVGGGRHHVGGSDHPPHPPSGHGVGLGHTVDHDAPIDQLGHQYGHGVVLGSAVHQVLVDLVGHHPQTLRRRPPADGLDLVPGIDRSGGVGRRDEQEHLGTRGGGRLELVEGDPETARGVGGDDHRNPPGQGDHLGIGGPVGGEHQHFVAGVTKSGESVGDGLLAAIGHQDLGGG